MASHKEYLNFILEQISELEEITYRAMMREYIIYYRGKIVGGIYDDRLLVKPVKSTISLMPDANYELPYEGAKEMLLVNLSGMSLSKAATEAGIPTYHETAKRLMETAHYLGDSFYHAILD